MTKENITTQAGYTIIETMIAVSLFIIVITIGMGALLNANLIHQKSRDARSIIDNLSFLMEDMSRNLRTGSSYHCVPGGLDSSVLGTPQSGPACLAIAFEAVNGSPQTLADQYVYFITLNSKGNFSIWKSTDDLSTYIPMTPDEVAINPYTTFISVTGAEKGDQKQPIVTIRLSGTITTQGVTTPFSLQTSVSQRLLDI